MALDVGDAPTATQMFISAYFNIKKNYCESSFCLKFAGWGGGLDVEGAVPGQS